MKRITLLLTSVLLALIALTGLVSPANAIPAPDPPPLSAPWGEVPENRTPSYAPGDLTLVEEEPETLGAKYYHIRNHGDSTNDVLLWKNNTTCYGLEQDVLFPDENAVTTVWKSFGHMSSRHYMVVKVYNGSTGAWIVTRTYNDSFACVKAYTTNDYLVVIKFK